jgi:acetyl esterase/lipase
LASAAPRHAPEQVPHAAAGVTVATHNYGGGKHPEQTLDAYYEGAAPPRPWIAVIHGGSWAAGNKAASASSARKFQQAGFQVFNIEYRKTSDFGSQPGVPWASQRDDLIRAVDWIRAHAAQFGTVANRGAIYGFSAGGHLAMTVGLTGKGSSRVRAIASASGVLQPHRVLDVADSSPAVGHAGDYPTLGNRTLARWAAVAMRCPRLAWTDCRQRWDAFLPENLISADDPPVMMFQGTADASVPSQTGRAFRYWLSAKGVENSLTECVNWTHTEACAFDGGARQAKLMAFLKKKTA